MKEAPLFLTGLFKLVQKLYECPAYIHTRYSSRYKRKQPYSDRSMT